MILQKYLIDYPTIQNLVKIQFWLFIQKTTREVSESGTGKKEEELKLLRKATNEVDKPIVPTR